MAKLGVVLLIAATIASALAQFPKFGKKHVAAINPVLREEEVKIELEHELDEKMEVLMEEKACLWNSKCEQCLENAECVFYINVVGHGLAPSLCSWKHQDVPLGYVVLHKVEKAAECKSSTLQPYAKNRSTTASPPLPPYMIEIYHHPNKTGTGWSHEDYFSIPDRRETVEERAFSGSSFSFGITGGLGIGFALAVAGFLLYKRTRRRFRFQPRSESIRMSDLRARIFDEDMV